MSVQLRNCYIGYKNYSKADLRAEAQQTAMKFMFLAALLSQFHIEDCFIRDTGSRSGIQETVLLSSDTKDHLAFFITRDSDFPIWVSVSLTRSYKKKPNITGNKKRNYSSWFVMLKIPTELHICHWSTAFRKLGKGQAIYYCSA